MLSLNMVLEARRKLEGVILPTRLIKSPYFSERFGKEIYFKLENLQITGAFKVRGAYYKMLKVLEGSSAEGVICASTGNHAQGVAFAGQRLGVPVLVVMPQGTPMVKVEAVRNFGAEVIFSAGRTFEEAFLKAEKISKREQLFFIHPFDDESIIAGQGTIGLEICYELPRVGTIVVPIGGGGLISGISFAAKNLAREKGIMAPKMVGVRSYTKIAEGIYCKKIGKKTSVLMDEYVDAIIRVEEDEIALAVLMLLEKSNLVVEGAGAVGLAAMLSDKINNLPEPIVIVLSGGNIDIGLISKIIQKGLHIQKRMVSLEVDVDDWPGVLAELTPLIAAQKANIYDIVHARSLPDLSLTKSRLTITLEVWGEEHISEIVKAIRSAGHKVKIKDLNDEQGAEI